MYVLTLTILDNYFPTEILNKIKDYINFEYYPENCCKTCYKPLTTEHTKKIGFCCFLVQTENYTTICEKVIKCFNECLNGKCNHFYKDYYNMMNHSGMIYYFDSYFDEYYYIVDYY
jgi:hypothetical protein